MDQEPDFTPIGSSAGETEYLSPEPPEERYPFWGYGDILLSLALALPSFALAAGFTMLFFWVTEWSPPSPAFRLLPAQFLGYGFWFFSVRLAFRARYHRSFREAMRWNLRVDLAGRAIRAGLGVALGVIIMGVVLRTPQIDSPMYELLKDPFSLALVGAFAITLGPVCEELAFRGLLQPVLIRGLGVIPGIALAALPFALLHGPQYSWSWRHVVLITLAGCSFGWMRYKSDSTAAAALMHGAYNLVLFSGLFFERQITK